LTGKEKKEGENLGALEEEGRIREKE